MSFARYFVFERHGDWVVSLDGTVLSRQPTRQEAERSAIVMADLMGSMRHDADVMVENGGTLSLAWTYGADPLPSSPSPALDHAA